MGDLLSLKMFFFVAITLFLPVGADAGSCSVSAAQAAKTLLNRAADSSARSAEGTCALRTELSSAEVQAAALKVIQDPTEDLFLREDLIEAFGDAHLRRRVKVEEPIAPHLGKDEIAALEATVGGGAGRLLAAAQAVKSMDETQVVCPREAEFVRTLSTIARDEKSHVILRSVAVDSLEKAVKQMVTSKLYDERTLRLAQESLALVASAGDNASHFSGAAEAYGRLAESGLPFFSEGQSGGGRSLASQRHQ